ncbi:MAG: ImmA/IrrE family metallo-endopeptidase, partial [Xanthobacteraceae bacterium]
WMEADHRPYILIAVDKESFLRSQMDLAHELAHMVLHRNLTREEQDRDHDLLEEQAFRFASAFLMPASSFPLEVSYPNLSAFVALTERWHVSAKAMIRRFTDLSILSKDDAQQLYKLYSAKGWNKGEPFDRTAFDEPQLLSSAIRSLVENRIRSKTDLLNNEFVVSASDVEQLTSLPTGWFSQMAGEVISLQPKQLTTRTADLSASILRFKPR